MWLPSPTTRTMMALCAKGVEHCINEEMIEDPNVEPTATNITVDGWIDSDTRQE